MTPSRLLTAAEVASMLSVPKSWVHEQALGRYKRFREEAVREWVERLSAPATRRSPEPC